ncbi:MAG: hypothetical protein CMH54_09920 [Myxococcales bacterium]|nr:hypothetical protein [Myxococcales bacterium]|tara:strand:+ start:64 stop:300 length:237 start_codon:yes stop_codon:yes gene_type:complete
MDYPRYFIEIDRESRRITSVDVITYSADLEAGITPTSPDPQRELIEVDVSEIKKAPSLEHLVDFYSLDGDNRVALTND